MPCTASNNNLADKDSRAVARRICLLLPSPEVCQNIKFMKFFITDVIKNDEAKASEAHHLDIRTLRVEDFPYLGVLRSYQIIKLASSFIIITDDTKNI